MIVALSAFAYGPAPRIQKSAGAAHADTTGGIVQHVREENSSAENNEIDPEQSEDPDTLDTKLLLAGSDVSIPAFRMGS